MNNSYSSAFFYIDIILAAIFLYSAWINLVRKRISKFGADAFIFILYRIYAKEKVVRLQLREHPQFIWRMGIITLIVGISFLNAAMENLKIISPNLHW